MIKKPFRESVVNKCCNRKNKPFIDTVIKFHDSDAFKNANGKKECNQSIKKILLFDFRKKATEQICADWRSTNGYNENINKSRQ